MAEIDRAILDDERTAAGNLKVVRPKPQRSRALLGEDVRAEVELASPQEIVVVAVRDDSEILARRADRRIPREDIIRYLRESDVFVMISKAEIFGLVYLEAMALGVIPIGSKNEGIDGIIRDGENGFLCEAGNVEELIGLLDKIKNMESEQLSEISKEAKATAQRYSDKGVAEKYIKALTFKE